MNRTAAMKVSSRHGSCRWPVIRHSSSYIRYGSWPDKSLGNLIPNWRRSLAIEVPMLGMSSNRAISVLGFFELFDFGVVFMEPCFRRVMHAVHQFNCNLASVLIDSTRNCLTSIEFKHTGKPRAEAPPMPLKRPWHRHHDVRQDEVLARKIRSKQIWFDTFGQIWAVISNCKTGIEASSDAIRWLTLHDLRRTSITRMQMAGVSEKEASVMVGTTPAAIRRHARKDGFAGHRSAERGAAINGRRCGDSVFAVVSIFVRPAARGRLTKTVR
jgi:hypothetical protein